MDYKEILEEKLSEFRYNHSLRVAEYAKKLANIYNYDEDEAYLTGLLHDYAKELDDKEILDIFVRTKEPIDDSIIGRINLGHGYAGAVLLKEKFDINDMMFGAIKYHTFLRYEPTLLEKIIFVADKLEEGRTESYLDEIRKISLVDLDKAVLLLLKSRINYLSEKSLPICLDSIALYNKLVGRLC